MTAGDVTAKMMFGEYGLYCNGKIVALVCDDQLFVKPTNVGRNFIGECVEGFPYPGSKPYLLISREKWEESEWMTALIRLSSEELPLPKKKARSSTTAKKKVSSVKCRRRNSNDE